MMNTVKHWKKSNLRSWRKQPSCSGIIRSYAPTMLFVSLIGTYLDLILAEKQWYSFPIRPFADVFKINIIYTLLILPIATTILVHHMQKMKTLKRTGVLLSIGVAATVTEQISEKIGWFAHSSEWRHVYSFFGYMLFMWLVWKFHRWMNHF